MEGAILERLVATLRGKEYDPEVSDLIIGGKSVTWKLEPSKHPEWKDICFEVRDSFLGDGCYKLREDSSCEIWFDEDGQVRFISYQLSPQYGLGGYMPEETEQVRRLGEVIGVQLIG